MATDIAARLLDIALFAPLGPDGVARLVDVGRVEWWNEGSVLLEEGSSGPRMMVVLDGRADVARRDASGVARTIAALGPGDVVGEMALLLDAPRTATVTARTDLRAFSMDRRGFEELVEAGDPAALRFGLELARVLSARLLRLNDVVLDLLLHAEAADPMRRRLAEARDAIFGLEPGA